MKRLLFVLSLLLFVLLYCPFCVVSAAEDNSTDEQPKTIFREQYEASGADGLSNSLPKETVRILKDLHINPSDPDSISSADTSDIFSQLWEQVKSVATSPLKCAAQVMAVALLCAVAGSLSDDRMSGARSAVTYISAVAIGAILLMPLGSVIQQSAEAIKSCGIFMVAFVPTFAAVVIASGRAATTTGFSTLVFSAAQIVVQIASYVISPCVGIYLAASAVSAVSEVKIEGLISGLKKALSWTMTFVMTVFMGLLSVQSFVGSASDSVGLRTAKFFVGSFVPVVGAALSESLTTVQSCLVMLRSTIGAYAVIAIAVILIPTVIELTVWRIVLFVSSSVFDIVGIDRAASAIKSVNGAVSLLIVLELCCGVLFIVSTTIVMLAGGGS